MPCEICKLDDHLIDTFCNKCYKTVFEFIVRHYREIATEAVTNAILEINHENIDKELMNNIS